MILARFRCRQVGRNNIRFLFLRQLEQPHFLANVSHHRIHQLCKYRSAQNFEIHRLKYRNLSTYDFEFAPSDHEWQALEKAALEGNGIVAEELVNKRLANLQEALSLSTNKRKRPSLDPRKFSYVLQAWANSSSPVALHRCKAILRSMHGLAEEGILTTPPTQEDFDCLVTCWAKENVRTDAHTSMSVEETINSLERLANSRFEITSQTIQAVMAVYSLSGMADSSSRLLRHLLKTSKDSAMAPLSSKAVNLVLEAWVRSNSKDAAKHAESLLRAIREQKSNAEGTLNVASYNHVIQCWYKSEESSSNSLNHAYKLLQEMRSDGMQPDATTYNTLIRAFCRANRPSQAEEILLDFLQDYHIQFDATVKPTQEIFELVLSAYSRSASLEAPQKAEIFLTYMKEIDDAELLDVRPSTESYNKVLKAWAKSERGDAAKAAHSLYHTMLESNELLPNVDSLNYLAEAYWRSGDPDVTEEVVWESLRDYLMNPGSNPRPNRKTFSTAMLAWLNSSSPEAPSRVDGLLRKMGELSIDGGVWHDCRPDLADFAAALQCCSKFRQAARADLIFQHMIDFQVSPNTRCWNLLLASHQENAQKIEELFQEMLEKFYRGDENLKPNTRTFTLVLESLSRTKGSKKAHRARELFKIMRQLSIESDVPTYNAFIECVGTSNQPDAAREAESIFREMLHARIKRKGHEPNLNTWNAVFKAWSFCRREEAVERVSGLLKELLVASKKNRRLKPNAITFGSILKTIVDSRCSKKQSRVEALMMLMDKMGVKLNGFGKKYLRKFARQIDEMNQKNGEGEG